MKIHHFEKRAPRPKSRRERDEEELASARPTVPELALRPPRKGGAAADPAPPLPAPKAEPPAAAQAAEPPPPVKPEPPPAKVEAPPAPKEAPEAPARASRKSRRSQASRAPPPSEVEPAPGSVAERLATARRLFTEGKLDEARTVLERLVTLGVATAPVHTQLGAIYLAQGATERALERFEEAISKDPQELSSLLYRGEARLARGDLLLAQQDLQRVLEEGTAGSPLVQRAQQLLQVAEEQRDRKRR
ncbi:tetratricopeptide repeat protein [Hyalangium rubrum]|uniref:Tetratricopeptide repeat protein n=1 Tax=Hyalangium rubrum TaxID=3103134 RepID=A0ABU5GWE8_9BACT|nr:tetratricopeptide repeat protein [Hyalangium sp. s54d21]MDY7225513.1 tetratricopeptide repeat protein [Hyalangium sp. s54d21]